MPSGCCLNPPCLLTVTPSGRDTVHPPSPLLGSSLTVSSPVRILEEAYEDLGDTLAVQYGGSQLVHRLVHGAELTPVNSHPSLSLLSSLQNPDISEGSPNG